MTNSARAEARPTVSADRAWWPPFPTYHSWLTLRESGPEFITIHFPSNEMGCSGNGSFSFPAHEVLKLAAMDCDKHEGNGDYFRAFLGAYYPPDYVDPFEEDVEFDEDFAAQLEEAIEELERHPELVQWPQDSEQEDGVVLFTEFSLKDPTPTMDARPQRTTTFPAPKEAPALQMETRYLLSLLKEAGLLDLDWEVVDIYYPEIEPEEFKELPNLETWMKAHFVDWLLYMKEESTSSDPAYPQPLRHLKSDLVQTYDFLRSSGLGVVLGEYNPQTDDASLHCDIICNFLNDLPPGAIQAVA